MALPAIAAIFAVSLIAAPAQAAERTPLIVVGTSDVYDSNLVQAVIEPGFEAAYPQWDLQYVSKGTGAAIAFAKAGTADVMIVHAAALENQFVDEGYSTEQYGRAIFWGDYVLLGPESDPAGVLTGAPHDIATAFEKIAAAGAAGTANFVSRGGTPGTTVQEHAIWNLTSGVGTCTVSAANGGGTTPSTATGPCANPVPLPSWYHASGLTQGPNITLGNACEFDGGGCYVFTDRGTFQYLQSTGAAQNLKVVTRDNLPSVRGTATALVNSFHAYGVSQAKFGSSVTLNTAGAADFLDWITAPAGQAAVGGYLSASGDIPFIPSAAPQLTASTLPARLTIGKSFTVSGTLSNVTPGTPALAGKTVTLSRVPTATPAATPVVVATATTTSTGGYSITFKPTSLADQSYSLSTPETSQVEDSTLSPIFGDILAGQSVALSPIDVVPTATTASISSVSVSSGYTATITVAISPRESRSTNVMKLYGYNSDSASKTFRLLDSVKVKSGQTKVTFTYKLASVKHSWKTRTWKLRATYSGPLIASSTTAAKTVKLK